MGHMNHLSRDQSRPPHEVSFKTSPVLARFDPLPLPGRLQLHAGNRLYQLLCQTLIFLHVQSIVGSVVLLHAQSICQGLFCFVMRPYDPVGSEPSAIGRRRCIQFQLSLGFVRGIGCTSSHLTSLNMIYIQLQVDCYFSGVRVKY